MDKRLTIFSLKKRIRIIKRPKFDPSRQYQQKTKRKQIRGRQTDRQTDRQRKRHTERHR